MTSNHAKAPRQSPAPASRRGAAGLAKAKSALTSGTSSTTASSTPVAITIQQNAVFQGLPATECRAQVRLTWMSARLLATSTANASARPTSSDADDERAWE